MRQSEQLSETNTEFQRMGDGQTILDDASVMRMTEHESEDSSMKFGSKERERPMTMKERKVKASVRSSNGNVLEEQSDNNKVAKPQVR
jgi:hypothetical protein